MMPSSFTWIIKQQLAGSGQPGLLQDMGEDLAFIQEVGIRRIFNLTERPIEGPYADFQLEPFHFPIPDMAFPTPRDCADLCKKVLDGIEERPALLHCKAGLGRTGTVAACCLVIQGLDGDAALKKVRCLNTNYVQTGGQENFIRNFAEFVKSEAL